MGQRLKYENLLRMEFLAKHHLVDESRGSEIHWTDTEEANLCDFLRIFLESRDNHSADPYYYISHHVLSSRRYWMM